MSRSSRDDDDLEGLLDSAEPHPKARMRRSQATEADLPVHRKAKRTLKQKARPARRKLVNIEIRPADQPLIDLIDRYNDYKKFFYGEVDHRRDFMLRAVRVQVIKEILPLLEGDEPAFEVSPSVRAFIERIKLSS